MIEMPYTPGVQAIRQASNIIDHLFAEGWDVTHDVAAVKLESSPQQGSAGNVIGPITSLLPLALNCEVSSDHGFKLEYVSGQFELTDSPDDPASLFEEDVIEHAERAASGDSAIALSLPGFWTCSLTVDLAQPLRALDPTVQWHVVRRVEVLQQALSDTPWWEAVQLLGTADAPAVHVVLGASGYVQSMAWRACGPDSLGPEVWALMSVDALRNKRAAVRSATGMAAPGGLPIPEDLLGTVEGSEWSALDELLHAHAAACAWAWLSGKVIPTADRREAMTSLFGFRPLNLAIPAAGLTNAEVRRGVLALYRWTTDEESVDRVLAVRQVASLYNGTTVLQNAEAIRRGAEPIYRGLRSNAVYEVLRSQREARSLALDAARRTAEGVLGGTKAVAERALAALAGLGAAALAQTTTTAPPGISERLAFAIAVFLMALTLWSVFVEGPTLSVLITSLSDDLKDVGDLLTDQMRSEIRGLRSVVLAQRRATVARVAGPLAYLVVAAVALAYAHPFPQDFWNILLD